MRYRILAADDETELLDALELYFEKENMEFLKAASGVEALNLFYTNEVHILLLDVMMPGMDGFAVLRTVRQTSKIPAIMLTAKDQDYDKILGLELGADDYITKPYNPLEVVARVKAQLRRSFDYQTDRESPDGAVLKNGAIRLSELEGRVEINGEAAELTSTEYKILRMLMEKPGRIYTKKQIFERVWGEESLGDDGAVVMAHISNLRNKLHRKGAENYINTIKGLGYRMEKIDEEK